MKHSTKRIAFRCWHCKKEFETNEYKTVTHEKEAVAYLKCPRCGHTVTASYKPKEEKK